MAETNKPLRIAIADGNPADVARARGALRRGASREIEFTEGISVSDVLRFCVSVPPPDCLLIDFNLPDGSALDVLAAIPLLGERLPVVPVVVMTGSAPLEENRKVLRAGAQDFIGKQWLNPECLTRAVENAIERHAMAVELLETELALRASEEKSRAIQEQAIIGIVTCSPGNGRFLTANAAFCAMLGYTLDELREKTAFEITHPEDVAPDRALAERVLAGEMDSYTLEKRYIHKAGRPVWVLLGSSVVRGAAGEIRVAVGAVTDITKRKQAEVLSRSLMDGSADCIKVLDLDGNIRDINTPGVRLLEADDSSVLLGRNWAELWPDHSRRLILEGLEQARAGATASFEAFCPSLKGTPCWWDVTISPVREAATGRIVRLLAVSRDITERIRADQELRRRAQEFRMLADNSPDVLTRFDRELRHVFVNAAVEQATGRPREEFLGKTNRELGMPGELCDLWEAALRRVLDAGEPESLEFDYESPSGRRFFIARLVPEHGPDGQTLSVLGVTHDVTERRLAEREREDLLLAERAARSETERTARIKDEFLATLSHELRTPLNAIVSWAQLLQRAEARPDLVRQGIDVISRNAQSQSQLIADLLDMNRIISGKLNMVVQAVDPNQVVTAAVDTVRPAAEARGIRLELDLAAGLPLVRGDPGRLQQVFWNLLSNAVKFTPEDGRVTVTSAAVDGTVQWTVADTGVGLVPEFVPLVFDRFSQADSSASRKHDGLGLGLSIVKQLVELHGGTVAAESAGIGQGARFLVRLPAGASLPAGPSDAGAERASLRTPASLSATAGAAGDSMEVDLTGISVLLVDDQPDSLEAARRLLAENGAIVLAVTSGRAALDSLRRQRPRVLISDIGMAEMDGYFFIREVREGLGLGPLELPAAALTAFARSEDRDRALASGFQAHLGKPFLPHRLLSTVAALAAKRHEI